MIIKIAENIKNLAVVGDVHGCWDLIVNKMRDLKITNTVFIFCGDVGIGFEKEAHYLDNVCPKLNKILEKYNCMFLWMRGNHSDPYYFKKQIINFSNVKTIPDYTIINFHNKNILCIGGGISIDRLYRKQQDDLKAINYMKYHNCTYDEALRKIVHSYWEDEQIKYQPKVKEKINIICSHSAPSFCYPFTKGKIVQDFIKLDPELEKDMKEERTILDKVFNDYKNDITHWYYGHFHDSNTQTIDNVTFKLLNISEICFHNFNANISN